MFTMCGEICPAHPEKRCELSNGHAAFNSTRHHRAGDVIWNSWQGHKHLSSAQLAAQRVKETLAIDAIGGSVLTFGNLTDWQKQILNQSFRPGETPTFVARDEASTFAARDAEAELAEWWKEKAEAEIGQTVAKAVEYGSTDLIDIGRSIGRVAGLDWDDQEAAEAGIFFYLEGKLSRWRSALERGDRVSDDTLLDIGVYVRMAQRIRDAGGWPGVDQEDDK